MRDISKWFEARSSEQDAAGIRHQLDGLIAKLREAAGKRAPHGAGTVPDPEHPDESVNSA